MLLPIRPVVPPAMLSGQSNGKLDPALLVETPGQAGGPTVRLVEPAARAWRAMCARALIGRRTLKATSLVDSYRPYEVQERVFLERYTTTPNGTTPKWWRNQAWYLKPGYASAAVPGTSNHGWALAVDIGEERDGDSGTENVTEATVEWLVENADEFGFSAELQSEPWHWRYVAGDNIPPAVLAYERGDDDVISVFYWSDEPKAWWVSDGVRRRPVADSASVRADIERAGAKKTVLDPAKVPTGWDRERYLSNVAGVVDTEAAGGLVAHTHPLAAGETGDAQPQG